MSYEMFLAPEIVTHSVCFFIRAVNNTLRPMSKLTGVSTEIWGPKAWGFLHAVTFRYPEENVSKQKRLSAYQLLVSLERLLPCERCRKHFVAYMKDPSTGINGASSRHLRNRFSFSTWMVNFHNAVNERLGKPVMMFEEVEDIYSGDYVCPSEPPDKKSVMADLCDDEDVDSNIRINELNELNMSTLNQKWHTPVILWIIVIVMICVLIAVVMRWKTVSSRKNRELMALMSAAMIAVNSNK